MLWCLTFKTVSDPIVRYSYSKSPVLHERGVLTQTCFPQSASYYQVKWCLKNKIRRLHLRSEAKVNLFKKTFKSGTFMNDKIVELESWPTGLLQASGQSKHEQISTALLTSSKVNQNSYGQSRILQAKSEITHMWYDLRMFHPRNWDSLDTFSMNTTHL